MSTPLFGFAYSEKALAYLKKVPKKIRKQIVAKMNALADDPYPSSCKCLQGTKDDDEKVYRIRSGDYRILYVVRDNPSQIVILDIDHRKDVYR